MNWGDLSRDFAGVPFVVEEERQETAEEARERRLQDLERELEYDDIKYLEAKASVSIICCFPWIVVSEIVIMSLLRCPLFCDAKA